MIFLIFSSFSSENVVSLMTWSPSKLLNSVEPATPQVTAIHSAGLGNGCSDSPTPAAPVCSRVVLGPGRDPVTWEAS